MMNDASKAEYTMDALLQEIETRCDANGEATEGQIFFGMAARGYVDAETEEAIGALLDRGVIASTVSQSKHGFKACLRRAA